MAVWYHVETTTQEGTTWRTTQPLVSWAQVLEWLSPEHLEKWYGGEPARVEVVRYSDPEPI